MASERFAYVWRYTIDPAQRPAFLAAYQPDGEWTRLFSRDPSYLETSLLENVEDEDCYVTIDYWASKADRDAFRERYCDEFDSLDRKCEKFTLEEHFLGDYLEVVESDP